MRGAVVVDTNLLLLLIVGTASRDYIGMHKRLKDHYAVEDFELLALILAEFSDIVLTPHIVAETSSLARQIKDPARTRIQNAFKTLVSTTFEVPIASLEGVRRGEFHSLGVTDAVILHLCTLELGGACPTLLTADQDIANAASSLGYSVIDYREDFLGSGR